MTFEQASEELTDLVARTAGISPGDRVLDVGCGYGANALAYTSRYKPASVTGIDVTDVRITTGTQMIEAAGLADVIKLRLGDATKMDFADNSFDRLVCVESAFHFDTRQAFLKEAGRVLRPGGTLAMTDMIPRRGVDPSTYMNGHKAAFSGVCLENKANAYDADVYLAYLKDAGFSDASVTSIVDKSRKPFIAALERFAAKNPEDPRCKAIMAGAAKIREYIEGGEDYVLVFARKAG
jgi:microcystin synthetase protein McyJ